MFKFNFRSDEDLSEDSKPSKDGKSEGKAPQKECVEVKYHKNIHLEYAIGDAEKVTLSNGEIVHHVDLGVAEWRVRQEPDIAATVKCNSDLIPNVYEGGLKLWECAIDLTEYISSLDIAFRGLKVLELGCGVGVPGLLAYNNGAEVCFQDYNESVLNAVTIPSVALNLMTEEKNKDKDEDGDTNEDADRDLDELPRCRFYGGDWSAFTDLLIGSNERDENGRFDLILTSETTYCAENYQTLHDTLKSLLKPDGTIYLAAKSYYFGVGGNLRDFEKLIQEKDVFSFKNCKEMPEGVSREIMELKFKAKTS